MVAPSESSVESKRLPQNFCFWKGKILQTSEEVSECLWKGRTLYKHSKVMLLLELTKNHYCKYLGKPSGELRLCLQFKVVSWLPKVCSQNSEQSMKGQSIVVGHKFLKLCYTADDKMKRDKLLMAKKRVKKLRRQVYRHSFKSEIWQLSRTFGIRSLLC